MQELMTSLVPCFGALVVASLTILISNSLSDQSQKTFFQFMVFGGTFAAASAFLATSDSVNLLAFWNSFTQLVPEIRFALAIVAVGATYFGGAMYLAAPFSDADSISAGASTFLASCDNEVSFDIPHDMPANDVQFFEEFLAKLSNELIADTATLYEMPNEAVQWVDRMLKYTVAGGKMNRGLTVLAATKSLLKAYGREITPKERCQAAALGWGIEFLQAFFLVADDIMDGSVTRRGMPCWFRNPEVALIAINDSFILESFVYKILKRYFGKEKCYNALVDLFMEVTRQTEFGQLLDLTSQPLQGPIDLDRFTIERYRKIVKYKTAFYSFYLPVALAMIMSGISVPSLFSQAREILLIMGEYFQIQDDYLDCYGKPEVIGKIGTDIEDNKCSWLVVQALRRATPAQLHILRTNYGQKEKNKVEKVKQLYRDMDLEGLFKSYEEESYAQIQALLDRVTNMPKDVFNDLLKKIYKRSK